MLPGVFCSLYSVNGVCCGLQVILHTGDMRWQPRLAEHPALKACKVELLYMDTTYCLPKHVFPSQVSACFVVMHQAATGLLFIDLALLWLFWLILASCHRF